MTTAELLSLQADLLNAERLQKQYPCRTIENIVQNIKARIDNEKKIRKAIATKKTTNV